MPASSKQAQAVATAASCPCYQDSCSPLAAPGAAANASSLPALWPPHGCAGTLAHCEAHGHAQSEHGRPFKALCRNAPQCLATLLTNTTTAANAVARHSSKMPGKAMQDQANAQFLLGKEKPNNVDLSKGKTVEKISWKWPFHKILECTYGSKNLSQVCKPSPFPTALTCHAV